MRSKSSPVQTGGGGGGGGGGGVEWGKGLAQRAIERSVLGFTQEEGNHTVNFSKEHMSSNFYSQHQLYIIHSAAPTIIQHPSTNSLTPTWPNKS